MRAAALALCLVLLPSAGAPQGIESEAAFLTIPIGARLVGMGRAGVALEDAQAAFYNPALVALAAPRVALHRYDGPIGFLVHDATAAFRAGALGNVQVGLQVQTFGEFEISDEAGSLGTFDPQNVIGSVGLARSFGRSVAAGVRAKWIHSRVSPGGHGQGLGADAGVTFDAPGLPIRIGLAALDVGPDLSIDGNDAPLPTRLRAGVAGRIPAGDWNVLLAVDADASPHDTGVGGTRAGLAVGWRDAVTLRGGWLRETLVESNDGYTFGLGVRLGRFSVDFAREIGVNHLGDEIHFSLEYGR